MADNTDPTAKKEYTIEEIREFLSNQKILDAIQGYFQKNTKSKKISRNQPIQINVDSYNFQINLPFSVIKIASKADANSEIETDKYKYEMVAILPKKIGILSAKEIEILSKGKLVNKIKMGIPLRLDENRKLIAMLENPCAIKIQHVLENFSSEEFGTKKAMKHEEEILSILNNLHGTQERIGGKNNDQDKNYTVMKLIKGDTLYSFLEKQPKNDLPSTMCTTLLLNLFKALKELHKLNVSHGDVNPNNVMVTNLFVWLQGLEGVDRLKELKKLKELNGEEWLRVLERLEGLEESEGLKWLEGEEGVEWLGKLEKLVELKDLKKVQLIDFGCSRHNNPDGVRSQFLPGGLSTQNENVPFNGNLKMSPSTT